MSTDVLPALTATVRRAVHAGSGYCGCAAAGTVLADRAEVCVVRHGDTVAKAHAPGTDRAALLARMSVAAAPALTGILLTPRTADVAELRDRLVTLWPHGVPVDPDAPERAPWEEAAVLLARLHRVDTGRLPGPLPPMRGPVKAARAVARLRALGPRPGADAVLRAWAGLPAWARAEAPMPPAPFLCHGDLHLGQLVRGTAGGGSWLLIDVDDMGLGDPAWDLARPAAWHGCGLLGGAEWSRFLGAYRAAGGPAVPATDDPWPALDVPARALTVQTAALGIARAAAAGREPDEVEQAVIDTCTRMATVPVAAASPPVEREAADECPVVPPPESASCPAK